MYENKLASEIKVLLRQGQISHVVLYMRWEVGFLCVLFCFFLNWECFSACVSGVRGLRKHEQPCLILQLMRTKEIRSS